MIGPLMYINLLMEYRKQDKYYSMVQLLKGYHLINYNNFCKMLDLLFILVYLLLGFFSKKKLNMCVKMCFIMYY